MKTNLNFVPGIDWTQEDIVLQSQSYVNHLPVNNESNLSANYVTVAQQYCAGGFDIVEKDDYLSVIIYSVSSNISRTGDFDRAVNAGNAPRLEYYNGWYRSSENHSMITQLRIFKDRTYTLIRQIIFNDGQTLTYAIDPSDRDNYYLTWNNDILGTDSIASQAKIKSRIIHNDKDVRKLSRHMSLKDMRFLTNVLFSQNWSDLSSRQLPVYYSYGIGQFTSDTESMVENFLDINNDEYNYVATEFIKHGRKHGLTDSRNIKTLGDLLLWISVRNVAPKQSLTKEERAELLVQAVQKEWEDTPSNYHNQAFWARQGDDIILAILDSDGISWYGHGHGCKKLFAYNVKTKKRFYGECNSYGTWSFPIPSLNYITTAMWLGLMGGRSYRQEENVRSLPETIIKGGLTVNELFKGTNIEWILNNVSNCMILNKDVAESRYYYSGDTFPTINVCDLLQNKRIGTLALSILISTGIPMLEQLLKSKLFNLYFMALDDLADRQGGNSTEVFWDLDKKRSANYGSSASFLEYHGKAKNLKAMFGMNINTLRMIDDYVALRYGIPLRKRRYSSSDQQEEWYRPQVSLVGLDQILNVSLSNLDTNSLIRCLDLSSEYSAEHYRNIWSTILENKEIFTSSHMSPKQIINYIANYRGCVEELRDYLRMRQQLIKIQEVKPEIPDIFSEKRYPVKPGAAKRFIPFLRGMRERQWGGNYREISSREFLTNYEYRYRDAVDRGDLQEIYDDNHNLLGVYIHMTSAENLNFLHDDASYWIGFYEDEAKGALFSKAIERVQSLEWSDPKTGLQILAPTSIEDIKQEGHILSHCVASYVDPIIQGTENIVFLRRMDMPNHPFFTVEVISENGYLNIRQVHCYRNGDPTEADQRNAYSSSGFEVYNKVFPIIDFLQKWAKAKGVNANSIKSHYNALCARR